MSLLQAGDALPAFTPAPSTDGDTVGPEQLRGRPVVLFFYPKADTPG